MLNFFSTYHKDTPRSNQALLPSVPIIPAIKEGKEIRLAVGYAGGVGLDVLALLANESSVKNLKHVTIILGMTQDGLTKSQVDGLEDLENNYGLQVLIQENFHDKIVILPEEKYAMMGSANLNALLNPTHQEVCSETMIGFFEKDDEKLYTNLITKVNEIMRGSLPLKEYKKRMSFKKINHDLLNSSEEDVGVRKQLGNHKEGEKDRNEFLKTLSTHSKGKNYKSESIFTENSLELSDNIFYLPLNPQNEKSGVNSSQSKPRGSIARSPFELELHSPKNILSNTGMTNLSKAFPQPSEEFWGVFDLNGVRHYARCHRAGGGKKGDSKEKRYKNIRSIDSKILGYLIKGKLLLSNLIKAEKGQNDLITSQVLKEYGSDCLVFREILNNKDDLRQFYISFTPFNGFFNDIKNNIIVSLKE